MVAKRRAMYNCCLCTTNIIICIFTFVTICMGLAVMGKNNCTSILQTPYIVVDSTIFILSFVFLIISLATKKCTKLSVIVLTITILLTVGFFVLIFYNIAIMRPGKGVYLPDRRYDEFRLTQYSKPFQNMIKDSNTWNQIRKCLKKRNACKKLKHKRANNTMMEFYTKPLTAIESGCCKPSYFCNFTYVSPTNWTSTPNSSFENPDCKEWNNDPYTLCFDCESCKAGVLQDFKHHWRKILEPLKAFIVVGYTPV